MSAQNNIVNLIIYTVLNKVESKLISILHDNDILERGSECFYLFYRKENEEHTPSGIGFIYQRKNKCENVF